MTFYEMSYDLICKIKDEQIEELEKELNNYKDLYLKEKQINIKLEIELNEIKNDENYKKYKEKIDFNTLYRNEVNECNEYNQTQKLVEEIEKRL